MAGSNYSLLIANTGNDPDIERSVWRTFREHRIDGVLFVTMYHRDVSLPEIAGAKPCVLANCFSSNDESLPSVLPDDYQGGRDAAQYLIEQGHIKIACLTLNPIIEAARLRLAGFRDAMNAAGVPVREEWIKPAVKGDIGEEEKCAAESLAEIFGPGKDDYPTALLCGDDQIALQSISTFLQQGKRVPEDIAVVGFDDFQMISTSIRPAMTTMALPYYEIGTRAAERLFEILAGNDDRQGIERIACPVIERQSA